MKVTWFYIKVLIYGLFYSDFNLMNQQIFFFPKHWREKFHWEFSNLN